MASVIKILDTDTKEKQWLQRQIKMSKDCASFLIIYPYPHLDSNPTMALLLETLAMRGGKVDVLSPQGSAFLSPKGMGDNVNFLSKPSRYFSVNHASNVRTIEQSFLHLPGMLLARKYSAILGVDPAGLILADRLNRWARRHLVYISFELFFNDEVATPAEEHVKKAELAACKKVSLVLIQDEERAGVLAKENSIPGNSMELVPNSPAPQIPIQSDYLRKELNIPSEKRIVLYCGWLSSWSNRDEIEDMVSYWPEEYVLVIHMQSIPDRRMMLYLQHLKKTNKVFFSNKPLPRNEMVSMVSSADFGIAPYKPTPTDWTSGQNIFHMGFSSGKVAYYAMCGLPIIASSLPVYQREFANYNCGCVYKRIGDIGDLLIELDKNYEIHSIAARKFYKERLNPIASINRFCDRLIRLGDS